jgi:hypothetical protein
MHSLFWGEATGIYLFSVLSMKKFTKETFIFILPLIVSVFLMEFLLRHIPNDYRLKKRYLDTNSDKIEILFLGNSHAFYGLNPEYCKHNCFNAGYITQSFDLDLEILQKYEQNWSGLKIIVIPVSYFSFIESLKTSPESWRIKNYIIYYGIKASKVLTYYSEVLSNTFSINLRRITSYYIKGKSAITCNDLGWGVSYNSVNPQNLIETGKEAATRHTIKDYKYFNENVSALKSIIVFGQRHNIKIVLFTPPAFETYVTNLNIDQLEKTIQAAENISQQNDNCYYYNLLEDKSFSESDFYDADHLNEIGAKKLTLIIENLISDIIK